MALVQVTALFTEGILGLRVLVPTTLTQKVANVQGQEIVSDPHITLVRLDNLDFTLPPNLIYPVPPSHIAVEDDVFFVDSGTKQSCYVNVTKKDQALLKLWVRKLEFILERKLLDPKRVFHVSLSNARHGEARGSVGTPWEFVSTQV